MCHNVPYYWYARNCPPPLSAAVGGRSSAAGPGGIPKRDLWSVGVLAFLMLSGRLPHKAKTVKELQVEMRRPLPMSGRRWNTVSSEGRAYAAAIPHHRPTACSQLLISQPSFQF